MFNHPWPIPAKSRERNATTNMRTWFGWLTRQADDLTDAWPRELARRLLSAITATAGRDPRGREGRAAKTLERWAGEVGASDLARSTELALGGSVAHGSPGDSCPYAQHEQAALASFMAISVCAVRRFAPHLPPYEVEIAWARRRASGNHADRYGIRVSADGVQALEPGKAPPPRCPPSELSADEWNRFFEQPERRDSALWKQFVDVTQAERLSLFTLLSSASILRELVGVNPGIERHRVPWEPILTRFGYRAWGCESLGFHRAPLIQRDLHEPCDTEPRWECRLATPSTRSHAGPHRPSGWRPRHRVPATPVRLLSVGSSQPFALVGATDEVPHVSGDDETRTGMSSGTSTELQCQGFAPPSTALTRIPLSAKLLLARATSEGRPWDWLVTNGQMGLTALTRWIGREARTILLPSDLGLLQELEDATLFMSPPPIGLPEWLLDDLFDWCAEETPAPTT